jgi:hypothetical protein
LVHFLTETTTALQKSSDIVIADRELAFAVLAIKASIVLNVKILTLKLDLTVFQRSCAQMTVTVPACAISTMAHALVSPIARVNLARPSCAVSIALFVSVVPKRDAYSAALAIT